MFVLPKELDIAILGTGSICYVLYARLCCIYNSGVIGLVGYKFGVSNRPVTQ